MSSTLQTEKTKLDAKALGNDLLQHGHNAVQHIKDGAHKLGVATGLSKPTTGEKIGSKIESAVDTVTGENQYVGGSSSSTTDSTVSNKGACTCKAGCSGCDCNTCHSSI